MKLSAAEEQLMHIIWKSGKVFMRDLLDTFDEPKPAATTVSTLLKRMQEKGCIGYILYGNSRQYYPLIKKEDYFSKHFKGMVKNFFDNSSMQFASYFTTSTNLSASELEGLKKIIDKQLKAKKK